MGTRLTLTAGLTRVAYGATTIDIGFAVVLLLVVATGSNALVVEADTRLTVVVYVATLVVVTFSVAASTAVDVSFAVIFGAIFTNVEFVLVSLFELLLAAASKSGNKAKEEHSQRARSSWLEKPWSIFLGHWVVSFLLSIALTTAKVEHALGSQRGVPNVCSLFISTPGTLLSRAAQNSHYASNSAL